MKASDAKALADKAYLYKELVGVIDNQIKLQALAGFYSLSFDIDTSKYPNSKYPNFYIIKNKIESHYKKLGYTVQYKTLFDQTDNYARSWFEFSWQ